MTLQQLLFDEAVDQVSLVEDCGTTDVSFAKPGGYDVSLSNISKLCSYPDFTFVKMGGEVPTPESMVKTCSSTYKQAIQTGAGSVDLPTLSSKSGALCGSNISSISRVGDYANKISIGTAGAYIAKLATKEHYPYYKDNSSGSLQILPTYHFLKELRRHLSGEVLDSMFSPEEQLFYEEYIEWLDGVDKQGETLLAIQALDQWLEDEVDQVAHPQLERSFDSTHPWVKLGTRT